MRQPKFRAWIEKYKEMLDVHSINFAVAEVRTYKSVGIKEKAISNVFTLLDNVPYIVKAVIMQFTGLKDKNGVDIYEKDYVILGNKGMYVIDFINGKFEAFYLNSDGSYDDEFEGGLANCQSKEMKVIGNIYQNPELLEEL